MRVLDNAENDRTSQNRTEQSIKHMDRQKDSKQRSFCFHVCMVLNTMGDNHGNQSNSVMTVMMNA
jgi:hypothetical protein